MSTIIVAQSGTKFKMGDRLVQLSGTGSFIFTDADDLDQVAEILGASDERLSNQGSQVRNLELNASVLNRQIIAGSDPAIYSGLVFGSGVSSFAPGDALDISYGHRAQKIYTDRGQPPANPTGLVQTAAPGASVIRVTFAVQVNSVLNDYKTGFTCKVAAVNRVINSAALQGGNLAIDLTLASPVTTGQAVLLSFDSTLSDLKNLNGAKVQSFTDLVVTNTI